MVFLCNAFSLNMIPPGTMCTDLEVTRLDPDRVVDELGSGFESCVGHADTARIFSRELGIDVPVSRRAAVLNFNSIIVGQYTGPRLPEGATELPEGATITWWRVEAAL